MSDGLKEEAKKLGFWNGEGDFHFAKAFSTMDSGDCPRFTNGSKLLRDLSSGPSELMSKSMMEILRNEESGICMREGGFISTSSQVLWTFYVLKEQLRPNESFLFAWLRCLYWIHLGANDQTSTGSLEHQTQSFRFLNRSCSPVTLPSAHCWLHRTKLHLTGCTPFIRPRWKPSRRCLNCCRRSKINATKSLMNF